MFKNILIFCFFISSLFSFAQKEPFNCAYDAYLFQHNDIYAVNLASGNSVLVSEDINTSTINAAAYNSADGYLWGYLRQKPKTLIRIGNDFNYDEYYIEEIPDQGNSSYVGDISIDGIYYYKQNSSVYTVDLNPNSENYLKYLGTLDFPVNLNIQDWAFNANDGNLYTVERGSNKLYRIDITSKTVTNLGVVPILEGNNYTYGAVYFDVDGNFYISANQTGTIYIIKSTHLIEKNSTMYSNLFAYGPASSSNDGARCPTAPVPTENCSNGVDDDGDGLVDCDDPSCSGVDNCAVLTPTTQGNNGGLESNNRLSQKIVKRNYKRSKTNHKFNPTKAPSYNSLKNVMQTSQQINIRDFIPTEVINDVEIIISSPNDLIDLTNAEDIFAVDYINNNNETVASILTMQTNNGIYEHTKYICDRLLGGEILSIGTIIINDQPFIKTIIKNPGGEIEHVISLAVRASENDTYTVESHWNLDKYTKNKTFYNFQIWSNNVNDLYALTNDVISSFNSEKTIQEYKTSPPPKVYVRKGEYKNRKLHLQVVNTYTNTVSTEIRGGLRTSETSETEQVNTTLNFEEYINNVDLNTSSLFDFGFRIEDNKGGTPDDLFVSDGPWGIDDSEAHTVINEYKITQNNNNFIKEGYHVERNLNLKANTDTYVSAYKAFNPRFRAITLNDYNTLEFEAKGTGELSVILMKESIDNWENQYKHSIQLANHKESVKLNLNDFKNNTPNNINLNDITMVVFLMKAEQEGVVESKEVELSNIVFTENKFLNMETETINSTNELEISVNPVIENTMLSFNSTIKSNYSLELYDISGNLIDKIKGKVTIGNNTINYTKPEVTNGIYPFTLKIENHKTFKSKLIFTE